MKVLFVSTPKNANPEDRELYEMDFMCQLLGFKRSLLDLGLVTVAGCTPDNWEVEYIDGYFQEIPYDTDADLVAISAKTSCAPTAYAVADTFRARGKKVVMGGIHASLRPDEALKHVDYVVTGEAEKTWPTFLKLFQEGKAQKITNTIGLPEMAEIPVPAWDKLQAQDFLFHQIQTTRGCPFRCRFCSVPDISGSSFRFKPIKRIINEINCLPTAGSIRDKMKALYMVDDNFISRTKYTKDLLKTLVPMYKKGELIEWSAETTLNVCNDIELLDLFAEAGCTTLIIGIESINEATLNDMDKKINFCVTYQEALDRIHERGMSVVGNFIVGFDTDTINVFQDLLQFIDKNNILYPFFSILTPMPGTKLHEDFKRDNRLDHFDWSQYDTRHVVFPPKNMTREELMDGYIWLYEQAYTTDKALDRLERFWRLYKSKEDRSTFIEKAYIKWRLRPFQKNGPAWFKQFIQKGQQRLNQKGINSDLAQLLYFYDSAHFYDYLSRFKSPNYEHNVSVFKGESGQRNIDQSLITKQWEKKKAQAKTPPRFPQSAAVGR